MHSVSKRMRISEPTTKISTKIDPYCQRWCSSMTLVSRNIRFMQIFAGVPWTWDIKRQWSNRKIDFQGFRTLRLRHLIGNETNIMYSIISSLVAFLLTPKYTTLHDLEWPFYIKFWLLQIALSHTYCRVCLHTWPERLYRACLYHVRPEMCGSAQWSAEYLGSAKELRIFRRRYIVGTVTNKANIII